MAPWDEGLFGLAWVVSVTGPPVLESCMEVQFVGEAAVPARNASVAGTPRLRAQSVVCREPGVLAGEAPATGPSCPGTLRGGPVYRGADGAGPCSFGSRHTQAGTHFGRFPWPTGRLWGFCGRGRPGDTPWPEVAFWGFLGG